MCLLGLFLYLIETPEQSTRSQCALLYFPDVGVLAWPRLGFSPPPTSSSRWWLVGDGCWPGRSAPRPPPAKR